MFGFYKLVDWFSSRPEPVAIGYTRVPGFRGHAFGSERRKLIIRARIIAGIHARLSRDAKKSVCRSQD